MSIAHVVRGSSLLVIAPLLLAAECSTAKLEIVDEFRLPMDAPIGQQNIALLKVSNTGDYDIRLGEISTAALGLSPPFSQTSGCASGLVLAKKTGSCLLGLAFAPTEIGDVSQTLQLRWNSDDSGVPDRISSFTLTARALPPVQITPLKTFSGARPDTTPQELGFAGVRVGTSRELVVNLWNVGGYDVVLGDVTAAGLGLAPPFTVSGGTCVIGRTLRFHEACTVNIVFTPPSAGFVNDVAEFHYSWQNGGVQQFTDAKPITASSLPPVTLSRSQNLGPALAAGTTVVETITVTNAGGGIATLGAVDDAALGLSVPFSLTGGSCVTGGELGPGQESCTLEVSFAPGVEGTYHEQLDFTYTWPGVPAETLSMRLFAGAVSDAPGNCYERGCAPGQVCTEVTSSQPRFGTCVEVPPPPPTCIAPCVWAARRNCLPVLGACLSEQKPNARLSCDPQTGWSDSHSDNISNAVQLIDTVHRKSGLSCYEEHFAHLPHWWGFDGTFSDGTRNIAASYTAVDVQFPRDVFCSPDTGLPGAGSAFRETIDAECINWLAQYASWTQCRTQTSVPAGTCPAP